MSEMKLIDDRPLECEKQNSWPGWQVRGDSIEIKVTEFLIRAGRFVHIEEVCRNVDATRQEVSLVWDLLARERAVQRNKKAKLCRSVVNGRNRKSQISYMHTMPFVLDGTKTLTTRLPRSKIIPKTVLAARESVGWSNAPTVCYIKVGNVTLSLLSDMTEDEVNKEGVNIDTVEKFSYLLKEKVYLKMFRRDDDPIVIFVEQERIDKTIETILMDCSYGTSAAFIAEKADLQRRETHKILSWLQKCGRAEVQLDGRSLIWKPKKEVIGLAA